MDRPAPSSPLAGHAAATAIVLAVTGACLLLRERLQPIDVAMVYLLAVVVVATRFRRGPSLLATALSIVLFDLAFVPPYGRLGVHDAAYLFTFAMMFVVAIVMSGLTARIRDAAEEAAAREKRTLTLYDLGRELAGAATVAQVADVATRHLGAAVGGEAGFAPADGEALLLRAEGLFVPARVQEAAAWCFAWDLPSGHGTGEFTDVETLCLPVRAGLARRGVLAIHGPALARLSRTDRQTLELLARQTALTLDRLALAEQHEAARVAVEAERLRSTLLSSLSHDLRTPLAGIEGAATALLEGAAGLAEPGRRDLAETIVEEARRMTRMVGNLLDMVRVESGDLALRRAWVPIEEVIGVARLRLHTALAGRKVDVALPEDQLLVSIDEILVEQVLVNLLENAVRYTPPGSPIGISAREEGGTVVVEVADQGPGIPEVERERVFQKFYRAAPGSGGRGTGLGLAICRGVITAHGGRIWVEERPGGGAAFRFTLPAQEPPPAPPREAA